MQDLSHYNPNSQNKTLSQAAVSSEALFFQRIYTWMFAGLAVTAITAYVLGNSQTFVMFMYSSFIIQLGSFVVLMGLVVYLSARIETLAPNTAKAMFLGFAAVMGASLCGLTLAYSQTAIFTTFLTTSAVYGAMALYGVITKRSLQAWGAFLFMGVLGIIIVSIANMFIGSSSLSYAIGVVGVLIFAGLTAYDHQRLRVIHASGFNSADGESRQVIMGALTLYLDFINLFLMLLRLRGN